MGNGVRGSVIKLEFYEECSILMCMSDFLSTICIR